MNTDPCRDNIIYPFVQSKIAEGYTVLKSRGGIDITEVCPNKKCGRLYYYTFIKGETTLKACPHCKQSQIINNNIRNIMNSTENFKRVISAHLEQLAAKDQLFAETFKKPNKNIDECITYILNTVKSMNVVACSEEEVYQMAVHYYDEDDLKAGPPVRCNVVSPYTVELTEEEKRQAKQEAIDRLVREEAERMKAKAKAAPKKVEPKQNPEVQPTLSLFD